MHEPVPWIDEQRRRWLRPDAARFTRPDAARWLKPQLPAPGEIKARAEANAVAAQVADMRRACVAMKRELAEIRLSLALRRALKYSPDQPRVPAGNPDGGQWTSEGGIGTRVRLAAADRPRLGRAALAALAAQAAFRLIENFRKDNFPFDLFGTKEGTVAVTTVNGMDVYGVNSGSSDYEPVDRTEALRMRDVLSSKYPDIIASANVGSRPNDALFHAETTVLLRAARENGGTLAGRNMEIYVDREMCPSCDKIVPLVALELGNPSISVLGPTGQRVFLKSGRWSR